MDLPLVELLQHVGREALDTEAQHAKSGALHGAQPLRRHRIDAIRADELQISWNVAARLRCDDAFAEWQNALVLREDEDVVLKDDRADARMSGDDALNHREALIGFESRDSG